VNGHGTRNINATPVIAKFLKVGGTAPCPDQSLMFCFKGQWEWDYDQTSSAGTHEQSSYNLPVEDAPYTPRDRSVDPSGLPRVEEEGQQEYRPENYRHDDPVSQVTQRLAGATIDPNPQGQSYEGQPYEGQPYEGQPYEGQPYEGQPYEGQPYEEEHHGHEEKKKGKGSSYSKKGKSRAREASHGMEKSLTLFHSVPLD
jgi:hypothetical protein